MSAKKFWYVVYVWNDGKPLAAYIRSFGTLKAAKKYASNVIKTIPSCTCEIQQQKVIERVGAKDWTFIIHSEAGRVPDPSSLCESFVEYVGPTPKLANKDTTKR